MKKPTLHTRWHCFNINTNAKVIRKFSVDATPPPPWARGTGPHSPEVLAKVQAHLIKSFKGVPKSAEQRKKISISKKGKSFTKEHRANMSLRWAKRRQDKAQAIKDAYAKVETKSWET